jgi:prepilin-type N-terminal cleavage/methylation domain-containing protein
MPRVDPRRAPVAVRPSPGFTLAELLVALTLLAVLVTVLFGALTAHVRLARLLAQRVLEADAIRTAATVLGGELRRAGPGDLRAVSHDSIALRAFRGIGIVCGQRPDAAVVHFRGDRAPEPAKDSLLWIRSGGPPATVAVLAVQPFSASGCAGIAPGEAQLWRTDPPLRGLGVLLLFESGTYYLADGALRYRVGAGGRQPLTAELFVQPPAGFAVRGPGAVEYRLAVAATAADPTIATVHYPLPSRLSR